MKKTIAFIFVIFLLLTLFSPIYEAQNQEKLVVFDESNEISYKYYNYQNLTNLLHDLQKNHSDLMSLESLGKTYHGRDIWLVKISDNVNEEEDEPGVLLMGAHHGNEPDSFEVLIYFIEYLVENSSEERVKRAINNTQIYIIPMVNPDGVEANTRKNCEPNYGPFGFREKITSIGVDLNRNYGHRWYNYFLRPWYYLMMSQLKDSEYNYRGEKPFSESETTAVKWFVDSHNISISLSYHGYLSSVMYPWWCSMLPTRDENLFISVASNISNINNYQIQGRNYYLGYRGASGTSEDWLYGEHGILAFCIELAFPQKAEDVVNNCITHLEVNLYICEIAEFIHTKQKTWLETHNGIHSLR